MPITGADSRSSVPEPRTSIARLTASFERLWCTGANERAASDPKRVTRGGEPVALG